MHASTAPAEVWSLLLDYVQEHVKPQQFEIWFKKLGCEAVTAEQVVVTAPNSFHKKWIENHFRPLLEEACEHVFESRRALRVVVPEGAEGEVPAPAWPEAAAAAADPYEPLAATPPDDDAQRARAARMPALGGFTEPIPQPQGIQLNPQYTFSNFVVGPSNRLAHAACLAVTEKPALVYNPLFLHGDVGLGKTHLLQAVCFEVLKKEPRAQVVYLSCEDFINQYIGSLQKGQVQDFRHRYRHVDLLLIDDIHFLSSKKALQEEFFHTFNALFNAQKQIILSCDAPPHEIPDLETRLVSRFKWGLVAEVEPPHYETKAAIIRRKAKARGKELPDDVTDFLAKTLDSNIRELEGAVLKVIVLAGLQNRPIDLALCREVLRELTGRSGQVQITEIMNHVANHFHVKVSDLQGKRRLKTIVLPRQICMYLARTLTQLSLEEIGGHFGGRDHTTVLYSESKVKERLEKDGEFRLIVERIARELQR